MNYFISIFLDTRRAKKNGKYPVKLRVFIPQPRKQKLYPTQFEFTHTEFASIWETNKPRKEHKETKLALQTIETRANDIARKLQLFTFEAFERILYSGSTVNSQDIVFYYSQAIEQYKHNNQIGTASNYELSLKSLLAFHGNDSLPFYIISTQWLKDYERFMISDKQRSQTTVGFYLRPLRAVFNTAISDKVIEQDLYPFGKRKYIIPAPKGVKKALSNEQLKLLFGMVPKTPEQQKAKDFWFFSYASNGMNFKDIANLKYKNISNDTLTFRRAKTTNTNKQQSPVIVYLNDFGKGVINKYGNKNKNQEAYIFPIINELASPEQKHKLINNFIRVVNQHFLKFAKSIGIEEKISTYWARHSFATNAIRTGASMEFVSEALNHSSLNTTKGYFAGFETDEKREISNKLMDF